MIFILVCFFVHSLCEDVLLYFQFVSDGGDFLKKKKEVMKELFKALK